MPRFLSKAASTNITNQFLEQAMWAYRNDHTSFSPVEERHPEDLGGVDSFRTHYVRPTAGQLRWIPNCPENNDQRPCHSVLRAAKGTGPVGRGTATELKSWNSRIPTKRHSSPSAFWKDVNKISTFTKLPKQSCIRALRAKACVLWFFAPNDTLMCSRSSTWKKLRKS